MKKPLSILATIALSATLHAAEKAGASNPTITTSTEPTGWWDGDTMTGDWGGLRTRLHNDGVDFFAYYNAILAANPVGGNTSANAYAHDIYYGFKFDLDKIVGWQGATFNLTGVWRDGQDISPEIGSQYSVMQLVGGQEAFLFGVNLDLHFFDDKLSLKFGHLTAGDDVATTPLYGNYLNNGIDGNIRAVVFDARLSAYPFAVWGARLRWDPTPEYNAMLGIYQVSATMYDPTRHGLDFGFHSGDGYMLIGQVGWTPELWKRPVAATNASYDKDGKAIAATTPEMKGYPGHYFFGAYDTSWDGFTQYGKTGTADNSYGFYIHGDQTVYQETPGSEQGLVVFGTVTYTPQKEIAIIPFQITGGTIYKGLIPGRDKDSLIFGAIYGDFSSDYARSVSLPNRPDPEREIILETGYRVQVNNWAYIQPDIQWVTTPGGRSDVPNALVVGAQFGVKF